jgi:hypothetical protein
VINQSKVYVSSNSSSDVLAVPFQTIVEMVPNDYVEVWNNDIVVQEISNSFFEFDSQLILVTVGFE